MCDVEFDRVEACWEAFTPLVRATLRSPAPWSEELLVGEIALRFPGLCDQEETISDAAPILSWKRIAHQVIDFERDRLSELPSAHEEADEGRSGDARKIVRALSIG